MTKRLQPENAEDEYLVEHFLDSTENFQKYLKIVEAREGASSSSSSDAKPPTAQPVLSEGTSSARSSPAPARRTASAAALVQSEVPRVVPKLALLATSRNLVGTEFDDLVSQEENLIKAALASTWENYGLTEKYKVVLKEPENTDHLRAIIKAAARIPNVKVRAVGDGHSWSPIIADNNVVLIKMTKFDKIEQVFDPSRPALVRLGSGVTTGQLARWFDASARGQFQYMGLQADVILDEVQYGGVYLPACHGCSNRSFAGSCADILEEIDFVNAQGEKEKFSRPSDEQSADFATWRKITASFGLIGICTQLVLRCETKNKIVKVVTSKDSDHTMGFWLSKDTAKIRKFVLEDSIEAVEVFWWPLNSAFTVKSWDYGQDKTFIRIFKNMSESEQKKVHSPDYSWSSPDQNWRSFIDKIRVHLGKSLAELDKTECGALHILYAKGAMLMMKAEEKTASRSGAIHYQKHIDDWIVNDIEVCFKLTDDWSNLKDILKATAEKVSYWCKVKKRNPVNVAMEFRITRGCKSALMSPAFVDVQKGEKDGYYIWIEVLGSHTFGEVWWTEFAAEMRKAWLDLDSTAKPHWCKWWEPAGTKNGWADEAKKRYKQPLSEFSEFVKSKDSKGLFRTTFWNNMLQ